MSSPKPSGVKIGAAATPTWTLQPYVPYYRGEKTDNQVPTGSVLISGIEEEGEVLTFTNNLADAEDMGVVSYQVKRDGVNISGATASTYTLVTADIGKLITVEGSYTDGEGDAESKTSAPTGLIVASGGGYTPPAGDGLLFDGWEDGTMGVTNSDGFFWGDGISYASPGVVNLATSVVTMEPTCGGLSSGDPTAIYNNAAICNGPIAGKDWYSKTGDNSLRFRYAAGTDSWAEQRFGLGVAKTDIWMRYWLRVPVNYEHRNINPNNKKFWLMYMDQDTSAGGHSGTVVAGLWYTAGGDSLLKVEWTDEGQLIGYENSFSESTSEITTTAFIDSSVDKGRWMQIVVHLKEASGVGVKDGVLEFWRRWDGETSFTKIFDISHRIYRTHAVPGWKNGYMMGYDNSGFATNTEWLMDDFTLSETTLV